MRKFNLNKQIGAVLVLGAFLACSSPAQAKVDFDWNNNQPVKGSIHGYENALETRLDSDYAQGIVDANEMAMLRRDLDGIEIQEDEFRMDHNGLGIHDRKCMANKLKRFDRNLSRAESDKFGETIVLN